MNAGSSSESLFKTILDKNVREAVICLSGSDVIYVNDSFHKLFFENSSQQNSAINVDRLFADKKLLTRLANNAVATGVAEESPVECIAGNDKRFYCAVKMSKVDQVATQLTVLTLCDITEIIRHEKLLRSNNDELKKLNGQLDRFLYSASHDIRQPLTSMMGLLRLLQMENPSLAENVYISKLNQSVQKLDEFLHQVILFTKNSHVQVKAERIDVKELVADRIHALQLGQETSFFPQFYIEVTGQSPFYSDKERLTVIIDHVLQNSVQYSDVTKQRPFVKVIVSYGMRHLYIEVVDNGIGISRMHLNRVTEMFYRASTASKGSGLGLYIVKETLSKLGGRMTIDSEVNLGTIAILEIPNDRKGILINKKRMLMTESAYPTWQ
jgi:signal transduction histidine kinase